MTKNISKKKYILVGLLVTLFTFVQPTAAAAPAHVYLEVQAEALAPESEFSVRVRLESGTPINALDLQLSYPSDQLQFLGIDTAHSIVDFWQASGVTNEGHIPLTGGMLNSFVGTGGLVATISFRALTEGSPLISFERSDAYLADGSGTKTAAASMPASLSISTLAGKVQLPPAPQDSTPPTLFIQVSDDATAVPLLVFSANDPESGVTSTQMRVEKWFAWSDWQEIQNPTPLTGGIWNIEVRTTNARGLTTTKALSFPAHLLEKIFGIFAAIALVIYAIKRYNRHTRKP